MYPDFWDLPNWIPCTAVRTPIYTILVQLQLHTKLCEQRHFFPSHMVEVSIQKFVPLPYLGKENVLTNLEVLGSGHATNKKKIEIILIDDSLDMEQP